MREASREKELGYYSENKRTYLEVYLVRVISIGHPGTDLEQKGKSLKF